MYAQSPGIGHTYQANTSWPCYATIIWTLLLHTNCMFVRMSFICMVTIVTLSTVQHGQKYGWGKT